MVLVPILLLNMLIAMMGNTYAHVIEQSEKEWVKQVICMHADIGRIRIVSAGAREFFGRRPDIGKVLRRKITF